MIPVKRDSERKEKQNGKITKKRALYRPQRRRKG